MSTTQKPKYMGKPFIKKIYETHKKWLGGESKTQKQEKTEYSRRNLSMESMKVQPDFEICEDKYPSVENISPVSEVPAIRGDKLRIVISAFDEVSDDQTSTTSKTPNDSSIVYNSVEGSAITTIEIRDNNSNQMNLIPKFPSQFSLEPPTVKPRRASAPKEAPPLPPRKIHLSANTTATTRRDSLQTEPQFSTYIVVKEEPPVTTPSIDPVAAAKITVNTPRNNTRIPKLVKAKTCSIIESKCILKKTDSNTSLSSSTSRQNLSFKTKSMTNLDMNAPTPTKIVPISLSCPKPKQRIFNNQGTTLAPSQSSSQKISQSLFEKCESNLQKNQISSSCQDKVIEPPKEFCNDESDSIESPGKVKDLVKRLNSLTDSNLTDVQPQSPPLSKAVSSTNLSLSKKHGSTSRIPVNSSLRKSFPSTPCHLDKIDSNSSTNENKTQNSGLSRAKSIQSLAKPRLSLQAPSNVTGNSTGTISKAKSVQNLAKSRLSLQQGKNTKVIDASKGINTIAKSKSVQNLTKSRGYSQKDTERTDKESDEDNQDVYKGQGTISSANQFTRTKSAKDLLDNKDKLKRISNGNSRVQEINSKVVSVSKTAKPIDLGNSGKPNVKPLKEKSKSNLRSVSNATAKTTVDNKMKSTDRVDGCKSVAKNLIKKTEVISAKMRTTEYIDPKDAFVAVKGPREKTINTVIKKLEERKEVEQPTNKQNNKILRNHQTFKKSNPVNEMKKSSEKNVENCKNSAKETSKKINSTNNVKRDLKSKNEKDKEGKNIFFLDPEDFIQIKSNSDKVSPENQSKVHLDYNSDNSDDSGNISNELDCDEIISTASSARSRTSSESLTTVLDASSVSVSKDHSLESYDVVPDVKPASNQIFFRTGVISQLEAQRDEKLAGVVISLQAHCRGYLARRKLQQKKLQDLAVRCIQRNVRKFMLVRDWPWWRLLIRVTPLLNVHRTEEELRAKSEELEALKIKLQKIEAERTTLKYENDKLEGKLSEMTADLAEEHSTATLAAERLDAETSERLRLEKELNDTKTKNRELQQASERLEMELLYAKSDLNGICEEDEDGSENDGVYKQRYERAIKELEFTKRRLQQQHEDDLEQLVGLKKQLEKKLADAYEEVEEQRQVVGTWKRKVQKINGEMNDLKLLLEEQSSRNNLLEKKQRKYDSEASMLQDELKKEKQAKERLCSEKEVLMTEKYVLESNVADIKLELELKEERLASLQREFDELTRGGKTEEEVTTLRKQKIDYLRRLQDQEEELDELAGQVQLLEQAKLRLEMTLESMRKEAKKEAQLREEELEEARCNAQKKVKALEQQLENEHEERTMLLREKHELERRLQAAADAERHDRAGDEALLQRLKRDLKRTKALLRDTQAQLERQKAETPGKNMIRQLKNQLEDLECARAIALKTKQSLEQELSETQSLLEEAHKHKADAEDRANAMLREKSDLQTQLEENEEELAEVLKKYKAAVQQMSLDQMTLQEQVSLMSELEVERNNLKEQLAELTSKLESAESMGGASSNLLYKRSELKVKELESKLELEQTTRSRLEVQITRLKETVDKLQTDIAASKAKEQQAQDQVRKLQRQIREVKEELNKSLAKESEVIIKKKELEKRCESLEAEASTTRTDLRLALKRIEDLQSAIQGELEDSISNESESEEDSYGSDESVNTFLANHKLGSPTKPAVSNDIRRISNASRSSTSSNLGKDSSYA